MTESLVFERRLHKAEHERDQALEWNGQACVRAEEAEDRCERLERAAKNIAPGPEGRLPAPPDDEARARMLLDAVFDSKIMDEDAVKNTIKLLTTVRTETEKRVREECAVICERQGKNLRQMSDGLARSDEEHSRVLLLRAQECAGLAYAIGGGQ